MALDILVENRHLNLHPLNASVVVASLTVAVVAVDTVHLDPFDIGWGTD